MAAAAVPGFCNDAPLALYGGGAKIISDGNFQISMDTETVVIAPGMRDYKVAAAFEFYNHGPSTTVAVGFPVVGPMGFGTGASPIDKFETWANGDKLEVREVPGKWEDVEKYAPENDYLRAIKAEGPKYKKNLRWLVTDIHFKGGRRSLVEVRYGGDYNPFNLADTNELSYLFGTGKAWRGNIKSALFLIRRNPHLDILEASVSGVAAGSYRLVRSGEYDFGYLFTDLEPEPNAEVYVKFSDGPWEGMLERCIDDECERPVSKYADWKYSKTQVPEEILAGLSLKELRLFRNTFFAGHGRVFSDPKLTRHFKTFPWYRPEPKSSGLSLVEEQNIRTIADYEQELKTRIADQERTASYLAGHDIDAVYRLIGR